MLVELLDKIEFNNETTEARLCLWTFSHNLINFPRQFFALFQSLLMGQDFLLPSAVIMRNELNRNLGR